MQRLHSRARASQSWVRTSIRDGQKTKIGRSPHRSDEGHGTDVGQILAQFGPSPEPSPGSSPDPLVGRGLVIWWSILMAEHNHHHEASGAPWAQEWAQFSAHLAQDWAGEL